jgi:hypothetical protein
MVNAFVEPVHGRDVIKESIQKLADEADSINRNYGIPTRELVWFCVDKYAIHPECATNVCPTFPELVTFAASLL